MLETTREGVMEFVKTLTRQLPNEMLPYLLRVNGLVAKLHQQNLRATIFKMDRHLEIFEVLGHLSSIYGANVGVLV